MRLLFLLTTLLVLSACHNSRNESTAFFSKSQADTVFFNMLKRTSEFSMSESVAFPDSNELYFYYERRFDTSLFVHIQRNDSMARVIVYQVISPYFNNDYYREDTTKPQFFDGYSFRINLLQWKSIADVADSILLTPTGPVEEPPFDGGTCTLAFNSKVKLSLNNQEIERLEAFRNYLKHKILYQQLAKKPQWSVVPAPAHK